MTYPEGPERGLSCFPRRFTSGEVSRAQGKVSFNMIPAGTHTTRDLPPMLGQFPVGGERIMRILRLQEVATRPKDTFARYPEQTRTSLSITLKGLTRASNKHPEAISRIGAGRRADC